MEALESTSLLRMQVMHNESKLEITCIYIFHLDGSSLSMGKQLRWNWQYEIFHAVPRLYWHSSYDSEYRNDWQLLCIQF